MVGRFWSIIVNSTQIASIFLLCVCVCVGATNALLDFYSAQVRRFLSPPPVLCALPASCFTCKFDPPPQKLALNLQFWHPIFRVLAYFAHFPPKLLTCKRGPLKLTLRITFNRYLGQAGGGVFSQYFVNFPPFLAHFEVEGAFWMKLVPW